MDIEAIRKRIDYFETEYANSTETEGEYQALYAAIIDRRVLYEHVLELEDRLRWRDVNEEKPDKDGLVELKDPECEDYNFGSYHVRDGEGYWETRTGRTNLNAYP